MGLTRHEQRMFDKGMQERCLIKLYNTPNYKDILKAYKPIWVARMQQDFQKEADLRIAFTAQYGLDVFICCFKLFRSNSGKRRRLKKKFDNIIQDAKKRRACLYFLTFTFSDEYLARTSPQTRRRLIQDLLKKYCFHFIANIDFGEDDKYTKREHYHALVSTNMIHDLMNEYRERTKGKKKKDKKGCIIHCEKYTCSYKSKAKTTEYITKLTNHSIKFSTSCSKGLIYDRNKEYLS